MGWFVLIIGIVCFAWFLVADGPWLSDDQKEKMAGSKVNVLMIIIGCIFAAIFIIGTLSEVFK